MPSTLAECVLLVTTTKEVEEYKHPKGTKTVVVPYASGDEYPENISHHLHVKKLFSAPSLGRAMNAAIKSFQMRNKALPPLRVMCTWGGEISTTVLR